LLQYDANPESERFCSVLQLMMIVEDGHCCSTLC
jgi:hypothetical protein